jgi:hypothetical protein
MITQWYLGIRPLWNKSNFVYVLFGRENIAWYTTFVSNTTRVKVEPGEPQPGPTREKRQKREKEKTPECQIPEVLLEADSPCKQ